MSDKQQRAKQPPLERIGIRALKLAVNYQHEYATLEHLLHSIIDEDEIAEMMGALGIDPEAIQDRLAEFLRTGVESGIIPPIIQGEAPKTTTLFDKLVFRATATGRLSSKGRGDGFDLLISMLKERPQDSLAVALLHRSSISEMAVKQYVTALKHQKISETTIGGGAGEFKDRAEAESYLSQYAANLNKKAAEAKIDPLIGRENEIELAIQIFSRKKKNNPLLIGEPGVGKTAIVEGMAHLIINNRVPKVMANTIIYSLDIGALVAGTKYRGDFEERMNKVMKAMTMIPNSVLFVDEIHMIMGAGSTSGGSMDAANLLKPALSDGSLRLIGSTTFDEFRKHFEKDRALLRRFGKISIEEPSVDDAKRILKGLAKSYEDHHGVKYTTAALEAAVDLTNRYVTTGFLPDKAIDIIDMAGARLSIDDKRETNVLDVQEIEAEVSRVARIPEHTIKDDESFKLYNLDSNLRSVVFGQDEAIETLVDAVFIARAGLREENKPQGAYLFTGPTGCGKTEVAKQFASTLGIPLIKFDMSEYMEKHSVSKLIGAPPGYVGFEDGSGGSGQLTNAIEQSPHCVLLLDEIEKAHPDVFNLLLQVMDDGKLTNSSGKTVSFRNVWLIMTSNAGVREGSKAGIGFGSTTGFNTFNADEAINRMFSPEFRNRLDARMAFKPLTVDSIKQIANKFVGELASMVSDRKVKLVATENALLWLVERGYDVTMGARPMKRIIADHIKKPLSKLLILGEIGDSGCKITVDVKNNELVLRKTKR